MIQRKFRTSWKVGKLQSQYVIWNSELVNCVTKFSLKWNFSEYFQLESTLEILKEI